MTIKPFSWLHNKVTGKYLVSKQQNIWLFCPRELKQLTVCMQVCMHTYKTHLEFPRKVRDQHDLVERHSLEEIVNLHLGGFWAVRPYGDYESPSPVRITQWTLNQCKSAGRLMRTQLLKQRRRYRTLSCLIVRLFQALSNLIWWNPF